MNRQRLKLRIRSALKWLGWVLLVQFVLLNISAALYAHKFSHFYNNNSLATDFSKENVFEKTWRLFTGPKMSKSVIKELPTFPYETIGLTTKKGLNIEAWYGKTDSAALGTVILFHPLTQNRSLVLSEAYEFRYQGYNVMLVDFRAHGNSDGSNTSLGYREDEEVKLAFDHIKNRGDKNIFLWGSSLGSVAIIKAIAEYNIKPTGVILEMPFESLKTHLQARVRTNGFSGFPEKPFAFLVTCWMGLERGFNGFKFKTTEYATKVNCPVLVQWGSSDQIVLKSETDNIFNAIASNDKKLVLYESAGHESFLQNNPLKWRIEIEKFLSAYSQ